MNEKLLVSVRLSDRLSACPPVRLSFCPSVRLSVCPFVRLSTWPSARPPVRLSVPDGYFWMMTQSSLYTKWVGFLEDGLSSFLSFFLLGQSWELEEVG